MAKVTLPSILRSLRSVTAAEVQAMYQAVASVLNGGLDAGNFARHLRIPNAMKNEPRSWFMLSGWTREWVGGAAADEVFFLVPDSMGGPIKVGGFGAYANAATASAAPPYAVPVGAPVPTASTIQLRHRVNSAAAPTVLASASFAALAPGVSTLLFAEFSATLAEVEVKPGEILSVYPSALTHGAGMTRLIGIMAQVWLRAEHLP